MTTKTDSAATAPEHPPIGLALRTLREATGLTLRDFSARAGFDHSFVSKVERDQFRPRASWLETYLETAAEGLKELAEGGGKWGPGQAASDE